MKKPEFIWIFNCNRRVYSGKPGSRSSPIWREHWEKFSVTGETTRSWIVSRFDDHKVPKKPPKNKWDARNYHSKYCFSEQDLDERCWVQENYYRIWQDVRDCKDYKTLKTIEELLK